MATTLARKRVTGFRSEDFIDQPNHSRRSFGVARLVDELVVAFFVAMAVMWVVTTITGIFR